MNTSIFLAQLLGPALLTVGVGILLHRDYYRSLVAQVAASRPLMFLIAMIGLVGGLAIVLVHNVWVLDWPVIITLLGWINVLRGIASILLPAQAMDLAEAVAAKQAVPRVAVVMAILGAILIFFGYFAESSWADLRVNP